LELFEALPRAARGRERDEGDEQRHRCEEDWPDHAGPPRADQLSYSTGPPVGCQDSVDPICRSTDLPTLTDPTDTDRPIGLIRPDPCDPFRPFRPDANTIAVPVASRPRTVLIVDQDDAWRQAVSGVLKSEYRVLRAASGETGWRCLMREDVDAMLLNVEQPGISGFETLRIARENFELTEVVMTAGLVGPRARGGSRQARGVPLRA
jgi:CheY-like chemotaxis protein